MNDAIQSFRRGRSKAIHLLMSMLFVVAAFPSTLVLGSDCGCDRHSQRVHYSHHCCHCCPPGLLDRLNNLSDFVEVKWDSLMRMTETAGRSSSCDACDTCDSGCCSNPHGYGNVSVRTPERISSGEPSHSSMSTNRFQQSRDHSQPSTNPSAIRPPFEKESNVSNRHIGVPTPPKPRTQGRLPEWLQDPFKDDARLQRGSRVRAASMRIWIPPRSLEFDPQASDHPRRSLDDLIDEIMQMKNLVDADTVAPAIARELSNASGAVHRSFSDMRTSTSNFVVHRERTDASRDQAQEDRVVVAAAFEPVRIAPVPAWK